MIQLNMNSKGALDRDTVTSINKTNSKSMVSAENVTSLNTAYTYPQGNVSPASPQSQQTTSQPGQQTIQRTAPQPVPQPVQQPAPQPVQRPTPALSRPVQKGQKVPIDIASSPAGINACFGWNTKNSLCDVDVSAFLLGENGKVIGDSWFVFYGQKVSPDQSIEFFDSAPNDCQMIKMNFNKLNPNVKKIVFVLTINDAFEKHLHFEMIQDAYVRIMNDSNTSELVSFKMTDYYNNVISMMIGEVYQHNGAWKFNAVGNGVAKDLAGLCELYGVVVE